jgi:transposase
MLPGPVGRGVFPPQDCVLAKALACEARVDGLDPPAGEPAPENSAPAAPDQPETAPPAPVTKAVLPDRPRRRLPLLPVSRFSIADLCDQLHALGIPMSYSTVWRTLAQDALRPWLHEQWLFPKDPRLLEKATPVLELYHRRWEGRPLGPRDYVLCADEMTGLQAVSRIHTTLPAAPGRRRRFEFEYKRHGTLCYLALLDVFNGRVYGETSAGTGIVPFEACLRRCLEQRRYQEAERLFLIVDNGSSHHPSTSPARLKAQFPNLTAVHLPVHSSWLNQIEIYFSIVHRKALTPLDFDSVAALEQRLKWFQWHYNQFAQPFAWNYTREKLEQLVERLGRHEEWLAEARQAIQARRAAAPAMMHPVTH